MSASISISPITELFFFIGITISDLVEIKQARYLSSFVTSEIISVFPVFAAEPHIPYPIGIFVCLVACFPFHGPKIKLFPSTK